MIAQLANLFDTIEEFCKRLLLFFGVGTPRNSRL